MNSGLPPQQDGLPEQGSEPTRSHASSSPQSESEPSPYLPPQAPTAQPNQPFPNGVAQFAPCPKCQNAYAKPVTWTFWGGILGPKLLSHVQCIRCYCSYNGKTGKSNQVGIIVYCAAGFVLGVSAVVAVIAFAIWAAI